MKKEVLKLVKMASERRVKANQSPDPPWCMGLLHQPKRPKRNKEA